MTTEKSKVYMEILTEIRHMIERDKLQTGDKIPSERELSEKMSVGRSSVREALRALELIGIIETRRGEGTFIKEIGEHQFIDILATFLLQDSKAKQDLIETKYWIEEIGLKTFFDRFAASDIQKFAQKMQAEGLQYSEAFDRIFQRVENRLLYRIWRVVEGYFRAFNEPASSERNQLNIEGILRALATSSEDDVLQIHKNVYNDLINVEIVE
ncbi:FadR/GntR family transcriptional regulator [Priestia koreensis]|uniref:FadR/GntR family transcriptional regulator n=2 Tax=Priestia koreensis TaxID=284581 RepID=UPI001F58766A|nr:GntR family transcriptional regulator [Priestia koreensis]MCM3002786.1 GntR family transcriptional regulator [Priestia koreensis]